MRYVYFVHYTYSAATRDNMITLRAGSGNCEIFLDHKVRNIADVKRLSESIKEYLGDTAAEVVVSNYKLMRLVQDQDNQAAE